MKSPVCLFLCFLPHPHSTSAMRLHSISHLHPSKDTLKWLFLDICIYDTISLSLISHNSDRHLPPPWEIQARALLREQGAGQGRTWGTPHVWSLGKWRRGRDAYLQPLALEARASEQGEAVFPTREAAAPPHPRTNTSVLPKGVSHHSPSEGKALSLAHSRN